MARLWFNVDIKGQFSLSWPAFVLRLLPAGKAERGPYSSFASQVTHSERQPTIFSGLISFSWYSYDSAVDACPLIPCVPSLCFPQQGFLPSEISMPSPNAISPSGLKSSSQFYSYDGGNPRRRSAQEAIGKKKNVFVLVWVQVDWNVCLPSLQRLRFSEEISLPHSLIAVKSRRALGEEHYRITSTTEIPFD